MTTPDTTLTIERTQDPEKVKEALALRYEVFVDEQGVAPEAEADEWDNVAWHWIARTSDCTVVGTARLRPKDSMMMPHVGKIERVAVKQSARTLGVGRQLMLAMEADAPSLCFSELFMHAQVQVEGFYHKLGYETLPGEPFDEEGIMHVAMRKVLT